MHRFIDLAENSKAQKRISVLTILTASFAVFTLLFGLLNSKYLKELETIKINNLVNTKIVWNGLYTFIAIGSIAYFLINALMLWYSEKDFHLPRLFGLKIRLRSKWIFLGISISIFTLYMFTFNLLFDWTLFSVFSAIVVLIFLVTFRNSILTKKK